MSLGLRITAVTGLTIAALFAMFTLLVSKSLEQHFTNQDFGELQAVATSLDVALGPTPNSDDRSELELRISRAVAGHHGVYFSVHDAQGNVLHGTTPVGLYEIARLQSVAQSLQPEDLRIWTLEDQSFRGVLLNLRGEVVLIAVSMNAHLRYLDDLRRSLWWATFLVSIFSVLSTSLIVRWGHAPLRRISALVGDVNSTQLHQRLPTKGIPRELTPLVTSFNEMLHQLQTSFLRLTHFSEDIAHELRTPVTNLTTQTQVALSKNRNDEEYREVLYSSLEELDRMGKMIGDMLFLAQADNQLSKPDMIAVDLAHEANDLFDYFGAWAEEAGVKLDLTGSSPIVSGDRLMIRRAMSNLIVNAIRYTPNGKTLTVSLGVIDGWGMVSVINPGKTVDAEHLPYLFDRFYRADPSRQNSGSGSGLGLAIVKSIVAVHGGDVSADSADGITTFTLRLPLVIERSAEHPQGTPAAAG